MEYISEIYFLNRNQLGIQLLHVLPEHSFLPHIPEDPLREDIYFDDIKTLLTAETSDRIKKPTEENDKLISVTQLPTPRLTPIPDDLNTIQSSEEKSSITKHRSSRYTGK